MYKRLFDEKFESYNEYGNDLSRHIAKVIKEPLEIYMEAGFSYNDIEKIAMDEIAVFMAEEKIRRSSFIRNNEKC